MTQDEKVFDLIVDEMTQLKNKHAVPRRSLIKPDEGELSQRRTVNNSSENYLLLV